jgi:hypothetical protein
VSSRHGVDHALPANWTTYRILCCTPPDLEQERCALNAVNAQFAERVTMPEWILFALASFRAGVDPRTYRPAIESNTRFCDFFVTVFGERSPDPMFRELVEYALTCTADPAFPMRSVVALFRNPEDAAEEMVALRKSLLEGGRCDVRDFHNREELDREFGDVLAAWHALIQPRPPA